MLKLMWGKVSCCLHLDMLTAYFHCFTFSHNKTVIFKPSMALVGLMFMNFSRHIGVLFMSTVKTKQEWTCQVPCQQLVC